MKHLNDFSSFNTNEHVYTKALATKSKNWAKNYESLLKYLTAQIEQRSVKEFKQEGDQVTFKIKGRKYTIDKKNKLFLYGKHKGEEQAVELELTSDQLSKIIKALKKPLVSPKAAEPSKKHPEGRKPYMD